MGQRNAWTSAARARRLKHKKDALQAQVTNLATKLRRDKTRLKKAAVLTKIFIHRTKVVAKKRIANANAEASHLLRVAKAKAMAIRMSAQKEAKSAIKAAAVKAAEMNEDTRSEMASDTRKQRFFDKQSHR